MLGVDILLYAVLIWYIEAVFTGKYGVSKPWYFPVMPLVRFVKRQLKTNGSGLDEEREGKCPYNLC